MEFLRTVRGYADSMSRCILTTEAVTAGYQGMDEMRVNGSLRTSVIILLLYPLFLPGCRPLTSRIDIYDRFRVSSDDIITDIVTGLQWKVGPQKDLDWYDAGIWIEQLGGNWRMPMRYELKELFDAGITTMTWGPFDNTGWIVWSVDYSRRDMSYAFCFIPNDVFLDAHEIEPSGQRVFAVLSPPGYWIDAQRTFHNLNLCGFLLSRLYSG